MTRKEYMKALDEALQFLAEEQRAQLAALLHDRMTESVLDSLEAAQALFAPLPARRMAHVDVLAGGRQALEEFLALAKEIP